jgi:hypothetical protein
MTLRRLSSHSPFFISIRLTLVSDAVLTSFVYDVEVRAEMRRNEFHQLILTCEERKGMKEIHASTLIQLRN